VVGSIATPLVAHWADSLAKHGTFFVLGCVLSAVAYGGLYIASQSGEDSSYSLVMVLIFFTAIFGTYTPIADSFAMATMGSPTEYGKVRLWGAIGFGLVSLAGGMLVEQSSWSSMFVAYTLLQLLTALIWGKFDFDMLATAGGAAAKVGAAGKEPGGVGTVRATEDDTDAAMWAVLTSWSTLGFFVMVTCAGALSGCIDTFLFVFLAQMGGGETCMGAARLVMCAAEVPFFRMSGYILETLGVYGTLSLVGGAYALRFCYYGFLTEPWLVLPAEVLHGITFAALWSATVSHAQTLAPEGRAAAMQGIVESLHWGAGFGLGALVGGYAYQDFGPQAMFFTCAACSIVMMLAAGAWEMVLRGRPREHIRLEEVGSVEEATDSESCELVG